MLARYGTLCAGIAVVDAVAGQESHLVLPDGADRDRGAGLAERRVQADAAGGRVEEAVEAAAADHSEHLHALSSAPAWNDDRVASFAQWIAGARPRTLPNAIAPVIAGTGGAAWLHAAVWWKALLALAVALALIIGVNFANDYSDGIRGTDDDRAGPLRLVGSRLAAPRVGAGGGAGQPGRRRGGRVGARADQCAVADRGRRVVHRRGLAVHRRLEAVRLCGFRRGRGVRVLRSGRGAGHPVHPGAAGGLGRRGAGGGDRCAVVGGIGGQQLTRHSDRRRVGQDHAGSAAGRQANTRLLPGAAGRRRER